MLLLLLMLYLKNYSHVFQTHIYTFNTHTHAQTPAWLTVRQLNDTKLDKMPQAAGQGGHHAESPIESTSLAFSRLATIW